MSLCKWHSFSMEPSLTYCFIVILLYIKRKWLLMRNLSQYYPWSSNCLENFSVSMLLMEMSKCWKILGFPKILIKMKILKHFTRPNSEQPEENYSASHQIKVSHISGTKIFSLIFTGIYKHLLSKCLENAVLGRLERVQWKCFFWHTTEACLLENLQAEEGFWLFCRSIFFTILSELRFVKWVRFFELNCIVK